MGVPWGHRASDPVTALIPTPLRAIRGSTIKGSSETGDLIFSNIQRSLQNAHLAVVRTEGGLGVCLAILVYAAVRVDIDPHSEGERPS